MPLIQKVLASRFNYGIEEENLSAPTCRCPGWVPGTGVNGLIIHFKIKKYYPNLAQAFACDFYVKFVILNAVKDLLRYANHAEEDISLLLNMTKGNQCVFCQPNK